MGELFRAEVRALRGLLAAFCAGEIEIPETRRMVWLSSWPGHRFVSSLRPNLCPICRARLPRRHPPIECSK